MKVRDIIDLLGNELQNAVIQNVTADTGLTGGGRIWFRSDTHRLKVHDGTSAQIVAWQSDSLSVFAVPSGDLDIGTHKVINVVDPTTAQQAATKNYVDTTTPPAVLAGDWKSSVKAASFTNATIGTAYAAGQTLDGYTLVLGDRILLAGQTTTSDRGIYTVTAGAPTRTADAASGTELSYGATVWVENGTVWGGAMLRLTSTSFATQVWSSGINPGGGSQNSVGGNANGINIFSQSAISLFTNSVSSPPAMTLTSTGVGLKNRTTPAAAIDIDDSTSAAGGIAFGGNQFQLYKSAANSLKLNASALLDLSTVAITDHGTAGKITFGQGANDVLLKKSSTGEMSVRAGDDSALVNVRANSFIGNVTGGTGSFSTGTFTSTLTAQNGFTVSGGAIALGDLVVTHVADPLVATDAANKRYVDGVVQGLTPKAAVLVRTTGAETYGIASGTVGTITGTTIDGVSPAIGDRVLIADAPASNGGGSPNSNQPANGIYVVTNNVTNLTFARAADMDAWAEVPSAFVWVEKGTVNADTGWTVTSDPGGTIGTNGIQWVLFASAGSVIAGAGLSKSGNTLDVNVDNSSIEINSDILRVKALGIVNSMVANSTIDLTTKVTGLLPVANGGTGSSTAAGARTNLGAAGIQTFTITGDGSTTTFTLTHSLNQNTVTLTAWDDNSGVPGDMCLIRGHRNSVNATDAIITPALGVGVKVYVAIAG